MRNRTLGNMGYGAMVCQNTNAINKRPPTTIVTMTWAERQGLPSARISKERY